MLEIEQLSVGYERHDVIHHIDLTVEEGECVCVIGANTAGKSSLLRAISGLVPRATGRITFLGNDLLDLAAHEIPSLGIAHVPEGRQVFPGLTVEENLRLGAFSVKDVSKVAERLADVFDLFPRLLDRRSQSAGTLSGGEQQMLAVGRALMLGPRLLMLDEPSHGLAPKLVGLVYQAIQRIRADGVSILLVEQNVNRAFDAADRGYVLESGNIVLAGPIEDLNKNDGVRAAYLGL